MKRWIGAGLLAATLMVTGCVGTADMGAITGTIATIVTGIIAMGTIVISTGITITTALTGV